MRPSRLRRRPWTGGRMLTSTRCSAPAACFLASKAVEREEWESYVEGIETKSRLEGLQALGFARYVRPEEREAFAREARRGAA